MKSLKKETKIIKWIVLLPIFAVIITSIILINIFISSKYSAFELEIATLEKKHISSLKDKTKERIEHISLLLNTNYENQIVDSQDTIKSMIYMGHSMLSEIYKHNKDLSKKELYSLINEKMEAVRFFDNNSGYFFIWDLDKGTSISLPSAPSLVGTSLKNLIDKKGKRLFGSYNRVLENNEGFDTWYWNKPGSKKHLKKIGYMKKFEPLNIGIGTAVYVDDIKSKIAKKSVDFIDKLKFSDNSYVFILDAKGKIVFHKNKSIINLPFEKLEKKTQENISNIIKKATNTDGSFIEYVQSEKLFKNFNQSKKISYVKNVPILDWVIGTGIYTNELNKQVAQKRVGLENRMYQDIKKLLLVSFIVLIIIIIFLLIISKKIKNIIAFYSKKLKDSNYALKKLNSELEVKVEVQVSDIRQKDLILNQQSKLAAMGEMLGNIAHQWRQPLSAISIIASGIRVKKTLNSLSDEQLDLDLKNIVSSTKMLSTTIDDFTNFYSNKKEISSFNIDETINQVISLVSPNLKSNEIMIKEDIENIFLHTYKNELIQALLNIINNAKDALCNIDNPRYIFINISKNKNSVEIEILDNAKGIKPKIIDRIFEPYFTTKFKSQGTGIGLYMTKKIVEDSLNGTIKVSNKEFKYEDENYKGASFIISIPLDTKS